MGTIVIDDKLLECSKKLKEELNNKRYLHSIAVMDTAACLSMVYGADIYSARLAGLLHDCAKSLSKDQLIKKAGKYKLDLSETERANPELLHAKVGKYIARDEYNINNKEVLDAIYYHTTGKPDMGLLEKIIFVADYIEPNRSASIPEIDKIRAEAFRNIDKCIALICENTLGYLKGSEAKIDKITYDTCEFYKIKEKTHCL